jgi:hypothetical protein
MGRSVFIAVLLTFLVAVPASARADGTVPQLAVDPDTPWLWVVPRLVLDSSVERVLSGFFAGLGELELELALVDREGKVVSSSLWKLVAGVPADYRLAGLADAPLGEPLSLVVSGLEAGPSWLALSLWYHPSAGRPEEIDGAWIHSDPSWLPGVRTGP